MLRISRTISSGTRSVRSTWLGGDELLAGEAPNRLELGQKTRICRCARRPTREGARLGRPRVVGSGDASSFAHHQCRARVSSVVPASEVAGRDLGEGPSPDLTSTRGEQQQSLAALRVLDVQHLARLVRRCNLPLQLMGQSDDTGNQLRVGCQLLVGVEEVVL